MTQMLIVRWKEGESYFEDYKIIDKDIPMEIALQIVENGDGEIVESESEFQDYIKDEVEENV